jgi:hypothetical protein
MGGIFTDSPPPDKGFSKEVRKGASKMGEVGQ